jgi:predicted nucleic acid-binding protein
MRAVERDEMFQLDANFLIAALVTGSTEEAKLMYWFETGQTIGMSSVAWGEFLCGPLGAPEESAARQLGLVIEPVLPVDAEFAARMFNLTGRRSRSFQDCLIGAVAIRTRSQFATLNLSDFAPLIAHGLKFA